MDEDFRLNTQELREDTTSVFEQINEIEDILKAKSAEKFCDMPQ